MDQICYKMLFKGINLKIKMILFCFQQERLLQSSSPRGCNPAAIAVWTSSYTDQSSDIASSVQISTSLHIDTSSYTDLSSDIAAASSDITAASSYIDTSSYTDLSSDSAAASSDIAATSSQTDRSSHISTSLHIDYSDHIATSVLQRQSRNCITFEQRSWLNFKKMHFNFLSFKPNLRINDCKAIHFLFHGLIIFVRVVLRTKYMYCFSSIFWMSQKNLMNSGLLLGDRDQLDNKVRPKTL